MVHDHFLFRPLKPNTKQSLLYYINHTTDNVFLNQSVYVTSHTTVTSRYIGTDTLWIKT